MQQNERFTKATVSIDAYVGTEPTINTVGDKQTQVANMSLAVSQPSPANPKGDTAWYRVAAWKDKAAELVALGFKTGDRVRVTGELRVRRFTGKNGPDLSLDVTFHSATLLSAKADRASAAAPAS